MPKNLKSFPTVTSDNSKIFEKPKFDVATIFGLFIGFGLVISAILMGGAISDFFDVASIMIVFGGTLAATTICFSLHEMRQAIIATFHTFSRPIKDPEHSANKAMQLAEIARAKGPLFLQNLDKQFSNERILHKGIELVTDLASIDDVARILYQESASIEVSQFQSAQVLQKASEFAPAMGLIGTLVGLVHMLGHLNDPATIGPSMAVAILTTFYGALLANLLFAPLASKLLKISQEDALVNRIYTLAILSISKQENPRQLETQLNSILPPDKRIKYFNK